MLRSGLDCTGASSARSLCDFDSQADIAISVFREVSEDAMRTGYHFLLASLKVINEKNWKRLGVLKHFFP